ncbi:MAG: hypothetical protein IJW49_10185 [Clostridia bacterium]|nr:hypothetical protein [Clostridia bacterium]
MLGYVKTNTPELRVREHQYYRGLYCGLCHRMGKCTGNCSRMTLSYDFVFLAAVRLALRKETVTFKKQRCLLHPLRARMTAQKCETLDYCADASALLVYHKLLDDLHDEKGVKKLRARLLRPFLHGAYRRAKKRHPALNKIMSEHLARLSEMEQHSADHFGADRYAEVFGDLLAAVVSYGFEGAEQRIAQTIGRSVGRWIYLADAADDFEEDRKKGRFNPYLRLFGNTPTPRDWETAELSMTAHLCDAERGFLLLDDTPDPEQKEIIANILFSSLPKTGKELTVQKNACGCKSKKATTDQSTER